MAGRGMGDAGPSRVVPLDDLAAALAASLSTVVGGASGAIGSVVIGCPGGSIDAAVGTAIDVVSALDVGDVSVWSALRSDRRNAGAFRTRHPGPSDGDRPAGPIVVVDAQWLDDAALESLVTDAVDPGRAPSVVIHRHGLDRPPLAELRALARRSHRLIDVGLMSESALIDRGHDPERAAELVADTGGADDLIDLVDDPPAFSAEIVSRLAVVDDDARRIAELLAFGLEPAALVGIERSGVDVDVDDALVVLTVEGLLVRGSLPAAVAGAVRAACPPGRRSAVVATVVEHGPAGAADDLAALLLAEGDRSPGAAELYADAARRRATDEPARALEFADAAVASGSDADALAVTVATARLGLGDPLGAIAALADHTDALADHADAELVRSAAWTAVGDLASALDCVVRSGAPALAAWPSLGLGESPSHGAETPTTADPDGARSVDARFAEIVAAWWESDDLDVADVIDELQRVATRARAERSGARWPVAPDLVAVQLAARDGDLATAARLAARADVGAVHTRTALALLAWVEARRGHLDAADATVSELGELVCSPNDRLLVAAARCAIAVREPDGDGLAGAVADARAALDHVGPHLHLIDVLADVAGAAARGRTEIGDVLSRCERLAGRDATGRSAADVARARFVATVATDDADAVALAASALVDLPPRHVDRRWRRAAGLLVDPGAADPGEVIEVARALADHDSSYEAARLCGLVALATTDAAAARRLLKESRVWRSSRRQVVEAPGADRSVVALSEQEERVGRMVVDGHTHKQVGAALFISPKTVEHHVAHIRTKLGCANRAEMMTALRAYLDG